MAGSRLEKIGTIYSRTTGLIKSGALRFEDRPLWYDIYEAFPPKDEPRYDRPLPNVPIKQIFYPEDKIRALFHKHNKQIGATNLFDTKHQTLTQRFIDAYKALEQQYGGERSAEELYTEAIDVLKRDRVSRPDDDKEISLSTAFREAQKEESSNLNIKIKDLFK